MAESMAGLQGFGSSAATKPWDYKKCNNPFIGGFGGFSTSLKSPSVNDEQEEKGLDQ